MGFNRILLLGVLVLLVLSPGCATLPDQPEQSATAVWDLEDLSLNPGSYPDLGQMLSARVMEVFAQEGSSPVVERQKLMLVLEELNLGTSDLADETTRLRVGRLSGATQMVFGAYQVVGQTMRIDLRLVDVSTGRVIRAAEKTASSSDIRGWMTAAQEAARELF